MPRSVNHLATCRAADHGHLIERHSRVGLEMRAGPLRPDFHREARLVSETEEQESDPAFGRLGKHRLPACQKLTAEFREALTNFDFRRRFGRKGHHRKDSECVP